MIGLSKKQKKSINRSNSRINIWEGAVRSGKTESSLIRWLNYICDYKYKDSLIITGKTDRSIQRNIIEPITRLVGKRNIKYSFTKQEAKILGVNCVCLGANDERSENKIRGLSSGGAYCDEVSLIPESFFRMLLSRLSTKGAKLFGTTNPDTPYHYLKKDFIDNEDLDISTFHFDLEDNTYLVKNNPAFIENLKKEYKGLFYKRFIKGLWVIAEGCVYDCFDEDLHVYYDYPFNKAPDFWIICCDYGTTNPTTFLKIGAHFVNGNWYFCIDDEYYYDSSLHGKQKSDIKYCKDLKDFIGKDIKKTAGIVIDPSAASLITQINDEAILPIFQADNDVIPGIRLSYTMMSDRRLLIRNKCKNTINEISGYSWDRKSQLAGIDKPIKKNDHTCDAFRYGIQTLLGNSEKSMLPLIASMQNR